MRAQIRVWIRKCLTRDDQWFWWCSCSRACEFADTQPEALNEALDHAATHHHFAPERNPE